MSKQSMKWIALAGPLMSGLASGLSSCGDQGPTREETVDDEPSELTVEATGLFQLRVASTGMCLGVRGGSEADGAPIVEQACDPDRASARWELADGRGGTFQLRPLHTGKCLSVTDDSPPKAVQRSCQGDDHELFRIQAVAGGVRMRATRGRAGGGECVGVAPSEEGEGASIVLSRCRNVASQRFELVRIGTVLSGDPLPGLSASELALFEHGKEEFEGEETIEDGLGPLFNDTSCGGCHNVGGIGGGSERVETRFGKYEYDAFDTLAALGGSLRQERSIGAVYVNGEACEWALEEVPPNANVSAGRRTTALFGLGLVDALPDSTFYELAASQPPEVRGRVSQVPNFVTGDPRAVGKFGWKAQVPTLFQFAGDAYLNELGITNQLAPGVAPFGVELCPNDADDCALAATCDPVPGIDDEDEDPADGTSDGVAFFEAFMKLLAPPPRGPVALAEKQGEQIFEAIGCASCHTPTFTTPSDPSLPEAMRARTFHPYSDFLLHDMGDSSDRIGQGAATWREMRTAPLWGLRLLTTCLHDGSVDTLEEAILAHKGQGEPAARRFAETLNDAERRSLLAFLRSL